MTLGCVMKENRRREKPSISLVVNSYVFSRTSCTSSEQLALPSLLSRHCIEHFACTVLLNLHITYFLRVTDEKNRSSERFVTWPRSQNTYWFINDTIPMLSGPQTQTQGFSGYRLCSSYGIWTGHF